jgi:hypothetical protein
VRELRPAERLGAEARRRALREALGSEWQRVRVLAEDVLGAESRIDWVAVGPDGETLLVLLGEPGRDLELIARGLAQRVFVEARLADWLQFAPDLGVRPELGVALLLLCPAFGAEALAAARALGPGRVALATCHFAPEGQALRAFLTPIELGASAPAESSTAPRAEFRTGLSDEDLGLSNDEHVALDPAPRESAGEFRSR